MKNKLVLVLLALTANYQTFARCTVCAKGPSGNTYCQEGVTANCDTPGLLDLLGALFPGGWTCENTRYALNPNTFLYHNLDGTAIIAHDGIENPIASDTFDSNLAKMAKKAGGWKVIPEKEIKEFNDFLKTDDGKVSAERLLVISKEMNVPIRKIKSSCPKGYELSNGECIKIKGNNHSNNKINYMGHVTLLRYTQLYLGYGLRNLACETGGQASIKHNENTFMGSAFIPFIRSKKGWDGTVKGSRTFGLNVGIHYMQSNPGYNISAFKPYSIYGQSITPTIAARGSGSPKAAAFKYEAGPQLNINFKRFSISPIVNGGYINMKEKAYSVIQTSQINGVAQTFTLFNKSEIKTKGLTVSPKLRLSYSLGRIGLWAEGHYTMGPTSQRETSYLTPHGQSDTSGYYKFDQVKEGTMNAQTIKTKYCSMGVNAGMSLSISRRYKCLICSKFHKRGNCKSKMTDSGETQD